MMFYFVTPILILFIAACSGTVPAIDSEIPGEYIIREYSSWGPIDSKVRAIASSDNHCSRQHLKSFAIKTDTKKDFYRESFVTTLSFSCVSEEEFKERNIDKNPKRVPAKPKFPKYNSDDILDKMPM